MGESNGLRVAFLGNWGPPHSSENHEALSYEALGHIVLRIQEGEVKATDVARIVKDFDADFFHHVQTYGLAVSGGTLHERYEMLEDIKGMGVPTVAFHLDLWHGLDREHQLAEDPYFRCDYFFSTDGENRDWSGLGINHHWLPPAVYHGEAYDGQYKAEYASDVAFVGSWRHYGHAEHWPVRQQMLHRLRSHYRKRVKFWPQGTAIRGDDLNNLYASVKVVVGDSCLAGKVKSYWSDRTPECTGRGGFLIHPHVPGILNSHPSLVVFEPENWNEMIEKVDYYLEHDAARESLRRDNAVWTRTHHTYARRMQTVIDTVFKGENVVAVTTVDEGQVR